MPQAMKIPAAQAAVDKGWEKFEKLAWQQPQFQEYKGRVALRGDTVKEDSGSNAVFTEQGSSALQMTAAKVMDLYGHPLARLLWKRQFEKVLLTYAWKKFRIGNAYSFTEKKGLFLSVYMDDIKLAGKKQNIDPMWKLLNKEVDSAEPTSFP